MGTGKFKIELTARQREELIIASEMTQVQLLRQANTSAGARDVVGAATTRFKAAQLNQATNVLRVARELETGGAA